MENAKHTIQIAFYGDDFTGSTDAMEFLCRAGLRTVLFIDVPTPSQLETFGEVDAIGVAGLTRSLDPVAMEAVLKPAFEALRVLLPRHVHYKVCSTFDSSPSIGSIGKALEMGKEVFQTPLIPLIVAAPVLGRYMAFGNLFARMGIGSNGKVYRLDRHPSMMHHPSTPATESDLRLHLAKQTTMSCGLITLPQLGMGVQEFKTLCNNSIEDGEQMIMMDAVEQEQLTRMGSWIDALANDKPLFSVGSSGIEMALGQHWNKQQYYQPKKDWPALQTADPLLVLSGSCSPITGQQIDDALSIGFAEVIITPQIDAHLSTTVASIINLLQQGRSVIVHTNGTRHKTAAIPASTLGTLLGNLALRVLEEIALQRILIAGGDTSSYVARALGVIAVEMIAPLTPGAPICKAIADNKFVHGLELVFKGGQLGNSTYFDEVRGGLPSEARNLLHTRAAAGDSSLCSEETNTQGAAGDSSLRSEETNTQGAAGDSSLRSEGTNT